MSTDLFSDLMTIHPGAAFVPTGDDAVGPPDDVIPPPDDPAGDAPSDVPSGAQCEVCGRDIPWSGRGRRPKWCMDHKTRTKPTADGGGRAPRVTAVKAQEARLDAIVGDLQEGLGQLSGTISAFAPVTAVTIAIQGPPATVALVRIAADHPRFLAGLEAAAKAIPYMAVGQFVVAVFLALAVDMGRAEPFGMAAEYLKVADAAAQVGWQPPQQRAEQQQVQQAQTDRSVPPPPRFKLNDRRAA